MQQETWARGAIQCRIPLLESPGCAGVCAGAWKCHLSIIQKAVPFWRHRDAQHMALLLALG